MTKAHVAGLRVIVKQRRQNYGRAHLADVGIGARPLLLCQRKRHWYMPRERALHNAYAACRVEGAGATASTSSI